MTNTELWSPVRAVALLVKLELPLRTYQVRMLDSGENDTYRYADGRWLDNSGPLAEGNARRETARGVFRRIVDRETGQHMTGLYINTNKTADINREPEARGYTIPWQHERVLYWLEKLRNWQEKYNPISCTTLWTELGVYHLGSLKSESQLAAMPPTCFLFRDASAYLIENRPKPVTNSALDNLWRKLLEELERRVDVRQDSGQSGVPIRFIDQQNNRPFYPLHSLRVSLLTCFALEGGVPLPVLSKLVMGHQRLIMSIYYLKPGMAHVSQVMTDAESKLDATAGESFERFLQNSTYEAIELLSAYPDPDGIKAVLFTDNTVGRNAASWERRHLGICLVGGNTAANDNNSRIGGCHNGGPTLSRNMTDPRQNVYGHVPGGIGNCVRCRWFITEPRYLDTLVAHWNLVSYKATEAARSATDWESKLEAIKGDKYSAEQTGRLFGKQEEYITAERNYERAMSSANELANDLNATFRLIRRCLSILKRDEPDASSQQLVAVGSEIDVKLAFEETPSELLQLAGVCHDAEIYPDENPGEAVIRRSQFLDSALYREGVMPIFMTLTKEEQLRVGNQFISHLANKIEPDNPSLGLRKAVSIIEAQDSLAAIGLLDESVNLLEEALQRPIGRLSDFTMTATAADQALLHPFREPTSS